MKKTAIILCTLLLAQVAFSASVCTISSDEGMLYTANGISYSGGVVLAECTNKPDSRKIEFKLKLNGYYKDPSANTQQFAAARAEIISQLIDLTYVAQGDGSYLKK
jgi:hypothetical protein